jgi:ribosome biogenesis GTPase
MEKGQVIKNKSNYFWILNEQGKVVISQASKSLTYKNNKLLIGDFVEYIQEKDRAYIKNIMPRRNHLVRPLVANVSYGLIVTSVVEPNFNQNLLDKIIVTLLVNDIEPIIVLTKIDLLEKEEKTSFKSEIKEYENTFKVFKNDDDDLIEKLTNIINNKLTFLIGNSGVGKSTLINKMLDSPKIKTNEISKKLGRGKHTTRHCEIYLVGEMRLIDTPGFGSLDFNSYGITAEDLKRGFPEFNNYSCKYNNCLHNSEPGCGVKQNKQEFKQRYESYLQLLKKMEEK